MRTITIMLSFIFPAVIFGACGNSDNSKEKSQEATVKTIVKKPAGIRLYTLGKVPEKTRQAIMDSLSRHYPDCKFVKSLPLPEEAITKKRNDHIRYRADLLNSYLKQFKTDSTIVLGLTSADIGLDDFRGRSHSGIFGKANRIGGGIAVISDYRCKKDLFRVVAHEFAHAVGLRHCKASGCILQDQGGKNKIKSSTAFCPQCRQALTDRHWK